MKKYITKLGVIIFVLFSFALISLAPLSSVHADDDFMGTIDAPTGTFGTNPANDLGHLIGVGIRTTFVVAGLTCLIFLLWGAFAWITSGGEQEKLQKAQQRIRNAVIGMLMVVIMFGVFVLVFGVLLNNRIINVRQGFRFIIPSVNNTPDLTPGGLSGDVSGPMGK